MAWVILLSLSLFDLTISSANPGALHGAEDLRPSYDYIIAGGGTSGLVVANRLTEDPNGKQILHIGHAEVHC